MNNRHADRPNTGRAAMETFEYVDARGELKNAARTTAPRALHQALRKAYGGKDLPDWATPKLVAMAQAECNRRTAEEALKSTPFGTVDRKNILLEIRQWQAVYDANEKPILTYLTRGRRAPTAQDIRDEAANDALETSGIGQRMREARGE